MRRIRIYIAGPMTKGDRATNYAKGLVADGRLIGLGFATYLPHHSFISNAFHGHHYEEWMDNDFSWIRVVDAIFRLPGKSPGADREVAFAKELGIPVFQNLPSLLKWAKTFTKQLKNSSSEVGPSSR